MKRFQVIIEEKAVIIMFVIILIVIKITFSIIDSTVNNRFIEHFISGTHYRRGNQFSQNN